MKTIRLSSSRPSDVRRAAALLKRGRLVAFATETVYGLGADAHNARAVLNIFRAKKRPAFDPLIVHVANGRQFESAAAEVSPLARRLARRFWPGPLTLIIPKSERIPDVVTAGLSTVAVRMPAHPCARKLLAAFGGPIAAPSANRFGCTSPTEAADVSDDLDGRIDAILDGGVSPLGIESTIVWPTGGEIILLRQGAVPVEALAKVARVRIRAHRPGEVGANGRSLLHPGELPTHYAPRTPMAVIDGAFSSFERSLPEGPRYGLLLYKPRRSGSRFARTLTLSADGDLAEAASKLFRSIRDLDRMTLDWIFAELPPRRDLGAAIRDRLVKAAGGRTASEAAAGLRQGASKTKETSRR